MVWITKEKMNETKFVCYIWLCCRCSSKQQFLPEKYLAIQFSLHFIADYFYRENRCTDPLNWIINEVEKRAMCTIR